MDERALRQPPAARRLANGYLSSGSKKVCRGGNGWSNSQDIRVTTGKVEAPSLVDGRRCCWCCRSLSSVAQSSGKTCINIDMGALTLAFVAGGAYSLWAIPVADSAALGAESGATVTRSLAFYGKGGVGKSTVVSNLTATLSSMGRTVLQVGCDPKRDSSRNLIKQFPPLTLMELLAEGKRGLDPEDIIMDGGENVDCIEVGGPKPGVTQKNQTMP